jgi:hypothetical protein
MPGIPLPPRRIGGIGDHEQQENRTDDTARSTIAIGSDQRSSATSEVIRCIRRLARERRRAVHYSSRPRRRHRRRERRHDADANARDR